MDASERNFSVGSPGWPATLDARLASLEDEALRLRGEISALQDDLRWLASEAEAEPGWLARGWVRASLLLATVGAVAIVSLPYLMHADPVAERDVAPTAQAAPAAPRAPVARPAAVGPAVAREAIPAPARVHAIDAPEPAREPRLSTTEAVVVTTPAHGDNSP
jgi:hypothetical protein